MKSDDELTHGEYAPNLEVTVTAVLDDVASASVLFEVETSEGNEHLLYDDRTSSNRSNHGPKFEVDDRYEIENVLAFDPTFDDRTAFQRERETVKEHVCPHCSNVLTFESHLVTPSNEAVEAIREVGAVEPLLVVDEYAHSRLLREDDDWRPFEVDRRSGPPSSRIPEAVCTECGLRFPIENLGEEIKGWTEPGERAEMIDHQVESFAPEASGTLGMATGGAKDVDNFRENIDNGHVPDVDSLSYEGLFYDYHFDTGSKPDGERDSLFYPTYSTGISTDPITDETEHYLTVGLNSTLSQAAFDRPRLNLVVVLDVSGSMSSPFDRYYYDETGRRRASDSDSSMTKMEATTESLVALTQHLRDSDRFGVVLYNGRSHLAKPLSSVGETDMDAIRGHIRDIRASGGTNMTAGLETAIDQFDDLDTDVGVDNRIIFMTDAMPNTGAVGRNTIARTVESAASEGIYTTFIGVGIDTNTDLIDSLSKIRGANHYFVNTPEEFSARLDDEFEFMVSPLVFDLQLELDGGEIEAIYGSPNADRSAGQLMHVATLFPSPTSDGETRGGVVLIKLTGRPTDELRLKASWEEPTGRTENEIVKVEITSNEPDWFENSGIRKAVVLTRYARTLREWIRETQNRDDWNAPNTRPRDRWERSSVPLSVSEPMHSKLERIRGYLESEKDTVGDETLEQEIQLLYHLLKSSTDAEDDLTDEERDRLRALVDLAPTKNAELAEKWGLSTGSDVHQYLEAHLKEFYYRDEQKLIRPTDKACVLVRGTTTSS